MVIINTNQIGITCGASGSVTLQLLQTMIPTTTRSEARHPNQCPMGHSVSTELGQCVSTYYQSTVCLHAASPQCVSIFYQSTGCVYMLPVHRVCTCCQSTVCLHAASPQCVSTGFRKSHLLSSGNSSLDIIPSG